MRLRGLCLLAFVFSSFLISAPLLAQTETGRITGVVTDQSGLIVPGATVTLTSPTTGGVRTTVTDDGGRYVIASVQPGSYQLRIEVSGFAPLMRDVQVTVGSSLALDTQLRVAGGAETVSVTAEVPFVNVSNAEIATTVSQEQIRDLPLLSRDPYDLVALAGNVQDQPREQIDNGAERGTGFSLNGQRASGSNVLLDGSANNNEFDTTVGQDVPLDSVQEFSVVTNNFSAQYGRASGGIVNVITKSGTNTLSGTAYTFFRNDSLASNTPDNIANDLPKGELKRNQPGYSIGGPIIRDKAHFFSSLEYVGVRRTDSEISWVPTPEFLAASSPATRAYFTAYDRGVQANGPMLTRADVSAIIGSGAGAFNSLPANLPVFRRAERQTPIEAPPGDPDDPQDDYRLVNKVDFNTSPNTMFSIRHAYQNKGILDGAQSANPYRVTTRAWSTGGTTCSARSRACSPRTDEPDENRLEPAVRGTAGQRSLGAALDDEPHRTSASAGVSDHVPRLSAVEPRNDIPFGGPQQLWQFYHDQTWLKGVHDIRFGGSYVHINDDRTFSAYGNAVEALSISNNALNSLNNFVSGTIERFQAAINPDGFPGETFVTPVQQPSFTSHNRYDEFALYVQDNWSATPRLTLNLGLRYEFYGPQEKSDPKYDSNFYYADPDVSVSSGHTAGNHRLSAKGTGVRLERQSGRRTVEDRLEQLRAQNWGCVGRQRRRPVEHAGRLRHGLRAELRQRDVQRPLQSASVPRQHNRCAARHPDAANLCRERWSVCGNARGDEDDSVWQLAPRRPEHQDRVRSSIWRVVPTAVRQRMDRRDRLQRIDGPRAVRPG